MWVLKVKLKFHVFLNEFHVFLEGLVPLLQFPGSVIDFERSHLLRCEYKPAISIDQRTSDTFCQA